jgi:hypothetical protein
MRSDDSFHTYFHSFLPSHRKDRCFIAVRIYWNLSIYITYKLTYLTDSPYRKSMEWFYSSLCFCINNILIQMTINISDRNLSQFYAECCCFVIRIAVCRMRYLYFSNLKKQKAACHYFSLLVNAWKD